jgi:hypothetical protein
MLPVAKDISKLLVGIPKGAWVALSSDQERVVAYAAELRDALQKSKAAGEDHPLLVRVPDFRLAKLFRRGATPYVRS